MLRVFHMPRTRSQRVVWMAEEMGVPYETVPIDLRDPSPELLEVNPSRTSPAIVDDDVVLTESVAILQYLADRYGPSELAVKPAEPGYSDYLQFLVLGEAGLSAPLNPVIGTMLRGPENERDNFTCRLAKEGFIRRLKLVERQLERGDYMAAGRFTAADISVAYAIGLGLMLGLADQIPASVKAYHGRMTGRPACQKVAPPAA